MYRQENRLAGKTSSPVVDNKASSTSFSVYLSEGGAKVISGREGRTQAKKSIIPNARFFYFTFILFIAGALIHCSSRFFLVEGQLHVSMIFRPMVAPPPTNTPSRRKFYFSLLFHFFFIETSSIIETKNLAKKNNLRDF